MSTVNISLPKEQLQLIDKLTSLYGFANRSEFIRSLIRLISRKPEIIDAASTYPFTTPKVKSVKKIISAFEKTNKYSPSFLKDLKEGLNSSNYFQD
ncbi:hypothetical protein A2773_06625 [Candidatus Gottesmanbacteria bacterium RIFCSPHIGHO2_01_FULL_39_10]|uniref:Uncharacterized protein n=1 Tax=Candidatus Gottesmanbacteria bacterium RIFCSPHIGHO2_01_FULL_39_10 TaxID=1798375 RepID=A0A1F5ZPL1_9BACT|nr:MAG: hypothetical protein A2773_06625 [Candidatus Gottesmanbacteria bacterium RIFCSPHIGHO2_01_FULL_39_10]